jgi:hypothetical protein
MQYYETLEEARENDNLNPFIHLIAGCVEESLQKYISVVK